MYTVIVILILIVCVLLAAAVLVQNSKGGGLAANFSAPNQIMGVRKTTETIEKVTWWLAIILTVLALAATLTINRGSAQSEVASEVDLNSAKSVNVPAAADNGAAAAEVPTAEAAAAEATANE